MLIRVISFNPAMLAAVRAGHKTVTRRRFPVELPLQQQPGQYHYLGVYAAGALFEEVSTRRLLPLVPSPFGQPGDILQVQEDPALRLRVEDLQAERVRSLTAADALAEGIYARRHQGQTVWGGVEPDPTVPGQYRWYSSPRRAFRGLLATIYPMAWARNEWMWVVTISLLPSEASCRAGAR